VADNPDLGRYDIELLGNFLAYPAQHAAATTYLIRCINIMDSTF